MGTIGSSHTRRPGPRGRWVGEPLHTHLLGTLAEEGAPESYQQSRASLQQGPGESWLPAAASPK